MLGAILVRSSACLAPTSCGLNLLCQFQGRSFKGTDGSCASVRAAPAYFPTTYLPLSNLEHTHTHTHLL